MTPLRPRLVAVWLTLIALIAAILILQREERKAEEAPPPADPRAFLPAPLADLGAVEIGRAGAVQRFERDGDGKWYYHDASAHTHGASKSSKHSHGASKHPHDSPDNAHEHRADPAQAERIASALGALERARVERRLPLDAGGGAQYGLLSPSMVIVVYRSGETRPMAQYAVGDLAPDALSRYVLRIGTSEVVTLPDYQIQNLAQLVQGMQKR